MLTKACAEHPPHAAAAAARTDPPVAPLAPAEAGLRALQRVVDSGLLRCGVPPAQGGSGGDLRDLATGAEQLLHEAGAGAAWVLRAQRLAIEALLRSPNVALREHLLPQLLDGTRAGTLAAPADAPLAGREAGGSWLIGGELRAVPNLQWIGFSLMVPVRVGSGAPDWVVLRSEEDGLAVEPVAADGPWPPAACVGALRLHGVFFRADEWLCGPDLPLRLQAVAAALARPAPAA